MTMAQTGRDYFFAALKIALGAGAVFGTVYVISRLREKQEMEARLDRLERLMEKLSKVEGQKEPGLL